MKKNVASQFVGAQLIAKADGTPVTTGTTTVYVTGDAGTQAAGSVGSGACTHEGNGFWTYAPAQAETNYDHVAFTFVNTSAVNATIQIYTSFPQTGDNFARLGAPAGASVSADVAAVKADTAAVKTKTDFLPSATAGASGGVFIAGTNAATTITTALTTTFTGNLTGSVGSVATGGIAAASFAAGAIDAAAIATDAIDADALKADAVAEIQSGLSTLNAAGVRSAVGLASANLDTQLDALPTAAENADAVWDEAIAGHAGAGSTGEALAAAGAAGDPWTTALPGSYTAGQAGYIVGTNVNATISSRATQTSVDDLPTNAELATALGTADDATLAAIAALTIPTTAQIADKILGRNLAGSSDGGRMVKDALRSLRNKTSISGGTLTVCEEDDSTPAWTAAVTTTAGDPLSAIDPT
jgi:hypothetical protein